AVFKAPVYLWIRHAANQTQRPDWALRDVARVSYVLTLLFWPAALRLETAGLRPVAVAMAVTSLIGAYLLNADAPFAALLTSSLAFLGVRLWGRRALLVWLGGVILYLLAAPLIVHALGHGPLIRPATGDIRVESWAIRLDIWRFAA